MRVHYTTETFAPSKELKFKLRKLAEIAALSKLCGQQDLYNQAKKQHDELVRQFNAVAESKKKGFWGKFLDNLANTTTYVQMADYLEQSKNYKDTLSSYSTTTNRTSLMQKLNQAIEELNRGRDMLSKFD